MEAEYSIIVTVLISRPNLAYFRRGFASLRISIASRLPPLNRTFDDATGIQGRSEAGAA